MNNPNKLIYSGIVRILVAKESKGNKFLRSENILLNNTGTQSKSYKEGIQLKMLMIHKVDSYCLSSRNILAGNFDRHQQYHKGNKLGLNWNMVSKGLRPEGTLLHNLNKRYCLHMTRSQQANLSKTDILLQKSNRRKHKWCKRLKMYRQSNFQGRESIPHCRGSTHLRIECR